jgi:hypothetical protein
MQKSEAIDQLATALSKVQGQLKAIKKDSLNDYTGKPYADFPSIWEACRELLASNGLSVSQPTALGEAGVVIVETMLMHTSGQWIMGQLAVPVPRDDSEKEKGKTLVQSVGSAVSHGRRYGFQGIVGVVLEGDDAEASGKTSGRETRDADPGEPLTLEEAKRLMDAQATKKDLAAWMNANRKRLSLCMESATAHFKERMKKL